MVPRIIVERLDRVRRREGAVRLTWGLARWAALVAAALLVACFIDWVVDRRTETPGALRALLFILQLGLWIGAAAVLLVRPFLRKAAERDLALWVEEKFPEFDHRLITAVELNRPGAPIEGMSAELLTAVTRQAEEMAAGRDFAARVDRSRLKRSALYAAAVAAGALLFGLAAPETTSALLARQLLADREIPRSVRLVSEAERGVHPTGESLQLRFRATSAAPLEGLTGEVRVEPEGRAREYYPLVYHSRSPEGEAVFAAAIPPSSVNFRYRAWLKDGRTRRPSEVLYEPRPVVQKIDAWVLLPAYCGTRPDGSPYEQYRMRGEIAGPKGSSVRVSIEAQKPLVRAALELLGRTGGEGSPETPLRTVLLEVRQDARRAEGRFEMRPGETSYRVLVEDKNGFANTSPPKRGIAIVPDEPPRVVLLPERFALKEETSLEVTEVEGMPVPIGGPIPIAYYCAHPYGLDRARLAFRVLKGGKTSEEAAAASEVPWQFLPLPEVYQTEKTGPFDLRRGAFEKAGMGDQAPFHPLPSPDPERVHGRTEGGGSFDFQTQPLAGVQVGDQIEFRVEVFARNPDLVGTPGRSETRVKSFVTQAQLWEWWLQTINHTPRLRQLDTRQRGVFAPEGTDR